MSIENSFLIDRLKSIGYVSKGVIDLIKIEANVRSSHLCIFITIVGFYFNISKTEWLFQIIYIGLVMSLEAINTTIEGVLDFVYAQQHKIIGNIKDISAVAISLAAVTGLIVGFIIYIPKLLTFKCTM